MGRLRGERGAVAVEFAFVLPLLLTIIFAVIELGHAYNVQISVTHAAREAARTMAITQDWPEAQNAALASSPALSATILQFPEAPACVAGDPVEVVLIYPLPGLTGLLPDGIDVTGKAAMQCGG